MAGAGHMGHGVCRKSHAESANPAGSWVISDLGLELRVPCVGDVYRAHGFPRERSHMYAVIKTGGKQYKVAVGEKIKVEQIAADVGQEIVIDQVLAVGNGAELKVGTPLVSGATVTATVVAHGKHDKVRIFKMRRRKHYQKRQGHRQTFTEIQIGAVNG
jgi:ribosomal protein L21